MPIITIGASDNRSFRGWESAPHGAPAHGIVVIQEMYGVNAGLRATVDAMAGRGYVALAPDLFWRVAHTPDRELDGYDAAQGAELRARLDWPSAIADLNASVAVLRSHPACDGRVATVGFCMGGTLAFMMGFAGDSDCDVSFHGVGLESLVDGAPGLRHPVQVHIGEADHLVPPDARAKITSTLARSPLAETFVYEGAEHGFARPESPRFSPEACELGFERLFGFLARHLGPRAMP